MTITSLPARERWNECRQRAGFTSDRELERKADLTAGIIWMWVRRNRDPSLRVLIMLKKLLGVSLDDLVQLILDWREEENGRRTRLPDTNVSAL